MDTLTNCRSIHRRCYVKKVFLKITQDSQEKACVGASFDKVSGLCNFIKKRLQHMCFPVKFAKFLRGPILKNICQRLLLKLYEYDQKVQALGWVYIDC